jgi:hypothetical protein
MQFRKYGGRKLMLDADGKDILPSSSDKDPALIKALVRSHRWEGEFRASDDIHLMNIVKAEKLGNRYVEKIYRLKFLSPKIKEALLDGTQPRTLTLSRLMSDIPLCWQEQARVFGL